MIEYKFEWIESLNYPSIYRDGKFHFLMKAGFPFMHAFRTPLTKFSKTKMFRHIHGIPFVIKTIRITSKVRLHCNKTSSFCPITILITNQTKPPIDIACFDCLRETETALDSLAGNRMLLSSTGSTTY